MKSIDPNGLQKHKVVPGTNEYRQISEAINLIGTEDPEAAKYLRELLEGGHIFVGDEMEDYAKSDGEDITLNQELIGCSPIVESQYKKDKYVIAASLVHEYTHMKQGRWWKIFHPTQKEDEAWAAEMHFMIQLFTRVGNTLEDKKIIWSLFLEQYDGWLVLTGVRDKVK